MGETKKRLEFCTRGGYQAIVYRAKFKNSYGLWITDYVIYEIYKPILSFMLVSFLISVITQFMNSFLV